MLSLPKYSDLFLIFLLAILFTGVTDIQAQHAISGTVTSADSGDPLQDVQVYIFELERGTVSNSDGTYQMENLPSGFLTLSFSYLGYQRQITTIRFDQTSDLELDIQLEQRQLRSKPVLITGARVQPTEEIALNTSVIGSDELVSEGSPTLWSTLENMSEISLETNGPGIERPVIRGLSAGRIKILNQNVEYDYQTWDPESGLSMNGNGTKQVEIIRGPDALEYGGGALGGVISLAHDHPAPVGQTKGHYQLGLFSNTLGVNNQIGLKGASEGAFWGFNGSFDTHADYHPGGGEEEEAARNSRFNSAQLQAHGGLTRSWGTTRISYEYLQHKNGIIEKEAEEGSGEMMGEEGEEEGRKIERPYHNLTDHILVSETDWYREDTHLNLTLGLQRNQQQEFEGAGESPVPEEEGEEAAMDLTLTSFNYEASVIQSLGETVELNAGVEGDFQNNESEGKEAFVPHADMLNAGTFAILHWKASDALSLQAGARYDFDRLETRPPGKEAVAEGEGRQFNIPEEIERSFNNASGSVGLSYYPGSNWNVKANAGMGYRTPNLAELTADGLLREIRRYQVGDNSMDSEYNLETDLGLGYTGRNISLDINGFYNLINNYIYQQYSGVTDVEYGEDPVREEEFPVFMFKQDGAVLYGGEAGFSVHPTSLRWIRLSSRFSVVMGSFADSNDPLPMMPAPNWNNTLTLTKPTLGTLQNMTLSVKLRQYFDQTREASFETETPGYLLTDLNLSTDIPLGRNPMQLILSAHNLFDVEYTSHLSLLKYDRIPNMGRNISLTARIPFNL